MADLHSPRPDEGEHLLRNAELRDELEPFFDESITALDVHQVPTPVENEFLASMLAWERAPILPISQWFDPPLMLPAPERIDVRQLNVLLWDAVRKLFDKQIVLDFTDHLSDRQLYCLIYRDILPSREKKLDNPNNYLHWDCAGVSEDAEIWLRYYATAEERDDWLEQYPDDPLPEREPAPYPRRLPRR